MVEKWLRTRVKANGMLNRFKRSPLPLPSLSPSPGGENPFEGSGKEIIV